MHSFMYTFSPLSSAVPLCTRSTYATGSSKQQPSLRMMTMEHQMKHMPSLLILASALCHIATIAVVMRGRNDLGTAPGVAGGSHRHLESAEPPHDPLAMDPLAQTVARLEMSRTPAFLRRQPLLVAL